MQINNIARSYLNQKINGYVSKDQKQIDLKKYLRLDLGENLLGCSPKVSEALKSITLEDLNNYADPGCKIIKNTIANLYRINETNITLANSSNEIIDYLSKIILNPRDKSLIIIPTFFRFIESVLSAGGKPLFLKLEENTNFEINNQVIEKIIIKINSSNSKIAWLCNPNNPTGAIISLDLIEYLVRNVKAMVILDEAFLEYFDLSNNYSGIKYINKYKNLIVLRTLSKAYGLAGLRLGYAMAHKKTIEIIEKYQNTLLMTSNVVQKLSIAALEDQLWLKNSIKQTQKEKVKIFNFIKMQKQLHLAVQSRANVYLLKHTIKDLYEKLLANNIITADFRRANGLEEKGYVRITVGNKNNNQKLINALKNIN